MSDHADRLRVLCRFVSLHHRLRQRMTLIVLEHARRHSLVGELAPELIDPLREDAHPAADQIHASGVRRLRLRLHPFHLAGLQRCEADAAANATRETTNEACSQNGGNLRRHLSHKPPTTKKW